MFSIGSACHREGRVIEHLDSLHGRTVRVRWARHCDAIASDILAYFDATDPAGDRGIPDIQIELRERGVMSGPSAEPSFYHGTIQAFRDGGTHWMTDGHSWLHVEPERGAITGYIAEASLEDPHHFVHVFVFIALVIAVRYLGLFHLHAASVRDPSGASILIVGGGGTGKTTTTLALISAGWHFLGDDALWLNRAPRGVKALAVRRDFHLGDKTLNSFSELRRSIKPFAHPGCHDSLAAKHKARIDARALFCGQADDSMFPVGLLFPEIAGSSSDVVVEPGQSGAQMRRLGPAQVFSSLLASSAMVAVPGLPGRRAQTELIGHLAASSSAFQLTLGPGLLHHRQLVRNIPGLVHEGFAEA